MRPASSPNVPPSVPVAAPRRQRSQGTVRLSLARHGAVTRVAALRESGPLRLRLPRTVGDPLEAVLLNSAGGIACGDLFEVEVCAGRGARAVLTTTAAEKIYRSDGPTTALRTTLRLEDGAELAWLPQETILFDRVSLDRRFEADLAPDASLTLFEALVFGREAHGERLRHGHLSDRWRIRRAGRLAYADTLRLDGPIGERLARPALGGSHRALATFLHLAPDAEARLEEARGLLDGLLDGSPCEAGASAWNGLLAVRLLSPSIGPLRRVAAGFIAGFRREPMPRVWQT